MRPDSRAAPPRGRRGRGRARVARSQRSGRFGGHRGWLRRFAGTDRYAPCCHPIPGDNIIGYLGKGEGLQVHTNDCQVALRMLSKDSDKWVEVEWGKEVNREFEVDLAIDTRQGKGVLARVASSVTAADSNILNVSMDDRYKEDAVTIRFTIQVSDRLHLSKVMRSLRTNHDVMRVTRVRVS